MCEKNFRSGIFFTEAEPAREADVWGQPTWRWRGAKWRVCVLAWPPVPLTGGVRVHAWQSRKKGVLIRVKGDSSQGPRARADGTKPLGWGALFVRSRTGCRFEGKTESREFV